MRDKMRIMLLVCALIPALCMGMGESVHGESATDVNSATERGDAAAQFRYAEMLRDGRSVKKNVLEAVVWTRKAADGGHASAQCHMSHMNVKTSYGVSK